MIKFTKVGALRVLLNDYMSERKRTKTSYFRVKRALAALGMDDIEIGEALNYLEYHDNGKPYGWLQRALEK